MKTGDYIIVRSSQAGVFAGTLQRKEDKCITLKNARRIWYWAGASSLSQLAMEGTSDPDSCKFPLEVSEVIVTEACELLLCTKKAKKSIASVKVWKQ